MSIKEFTIATTNFDSRDLKKIRHFYFTFSLLDTVNNSTLLNRNSSIDISVKPDRSKEEVYSFIPKESYQIKKFSIKHSQRGFWWTFKISTNYDMTFESAECLIIPIAWR